MSNFDALNDWSNDVLKGEKPPPGFTPVPGSKVGLWHKKVGAEWVHWKPGQKAGGGAKSAPTEVETAKDIDKLTGPLTLESVGEENLYFTDGYGKGYFIKFDGRPKVLPGMLRRLAPNTDVGGTPVELDSSKDVDALKGPFVLESIGEENLYFANRGKSYFIKYDGANVLLQYVALRLRGKPEGG